MAIKRISITLLCVLFIARSLTAQTDPVLFTVEGNPVLASEFKYIYSKTNGEKADFSKASIEEYLDLYTKFKLKVKAAKDMKLDTIPSLINELQGYRRQLSNSYLMDKELTEKLVREAYDRSQEEVNISHILVSIARNASAKDEQAALRKVTAIKKELDGGADWNATVRAKSDDSSSKEYGGKIGYFKALQLLNLYELESIAYDTKVGEIGGPIRTNLGYHIVKVNERQAARGEMNAAHILIRTAGKGDDPVAKGKIDALYARLQNGAGFTELAKAESEDKKTAAKGGELGFFGINVHHPSIEDAAFALKIDGNYSKPFRSPLGWHIIIQLEKKENLSYELAKQGLLAKVKKDSRYKITRTAMIDRIKKENNFSQDDAVLNRFNSGLDKTFFTREWKATKTDANKTLFKIGNSTVFLGEFIDYLQLNSNMRFRRSRGNTPETASQELYNAYLEDKVIKYEEGLLGEKYPEFKSLMREYEEGILLFEATKRQVWDKASADTVGLKAFYAKNEDKYNWKERALVSIYTIAVNDEKMVAKARKLAAKKSSSSLLAKINKTQEFLKVKEERYEKGRNKNLDAMNWKAGNVSEIINKKGMLSFIKIERILPSSPKTLKEARGYVVADYQDNLEKIWVSQLREKYKIEINQEVLNAMIK